MAPQVHSLDGGPCILITLSLHIRGTSQIYVTNKCVTCDISYSCFHSPLHICQQMKIRKNISRHKCCELTKGFLAIVVLLLKYVPLAYLRHLLTGVSGHITDVAPCEAHIFSAKIRAPFGGCFTVYIK